MLTLCGYIMCHSQYVQFLCLKLHFVTKKRALLLSQLTIFFKHLTIFNKKGQANLIKTDKDSVFTRIHAEFLLSISIDQSFKCLSKLVRVTGTLENLNLAVYLKFFFFQKYGAAAIFFLYGNKNVPSAEILGGRRCLRARTFILYGLINLIFAMKNL